MRVRRVVTGHDETGRSVFASDESVEPTTVALFAGWEFLELWGGDATPSFPDDGGEPEHRSYFPAVDGFRFSFSVIPPEGAAPPADLDLAAAEQEARAALPGMLDVLEPGDTVVQNGTRHRWRNPGSEPCVMAVFMVGAHRGA